MSTSTKKSVQELQQSCKDAERRIQDLIARCNQTTMVEDNTVDFSMTVEDSQQERKRRLKELWKREDREALLNG